MTRPSDRSQIIAYSGPRHAATTILATRFEARLPLQVQFNSGAFQRLSPPDQLLAREIVDSVLRNLSLLDFWLDSVSSRPLSKVDPTVLWILRTAASQLRLMRVPEFAAVDEAVKLTVRLGYGRVKGFVNGILRALLRRSPELPAGQGPEALATRYSHPVWITQRLIQRWGSVGAERLLAGHNTRPPSVVWVNPYRTSVEQFLQALEERQIRYSRLSGLSRAVQVEHRGLVRDPLYLEGHCFLMDPASQAVAEMVDVDQANRVADLCAAPGGKSFILRSRLSAGAVLISGDLDPRRLRSLRNRARQLGVPTPALLVLDSSRPLPFTACLDAILLDVPCSGLGTIRANPDLRWFVRETDLERHQARQRTMLQVAVRNLAPGGQLVYATCSSEPEENEEVVEPFLAECPDLVRDGEPYRSGPDGPGGDGYYAIRMRRREG